MIADTLKVVNIMNFVRQIDEREENSTQRLLEMTTQQLRLVNEYGLDNTFLLQYDAVCDENFVSMFKREAADKTELGLWYEIVEPLTTACGITYRSERGWKWDWHIDPGFSMAYVPAQREQLIDEAMRKFKEVFGYYPKTVGSWTIDTHTVNYLAEHYHVDAIAICRDQVNTDAYTMRGGYFNQAYYPSRNNVFTPAQSDERRVPIPVFRLLGPCPIHNYDNNKYSSDEIKAMNSNCFTLEGCWFMGSDPHITKWMFDTYYGNESLGFAYAQIGQENSFVAYKDQVLKSTRMQIEQLQARGDVSFMKMGETGAAFKKRYPHKTPATAVTALDNWDSTDAQSVYYDCRRYTANLFRFEDKIFLRSLYLFDEDVQDRYIVDTCTTFDAVYENLPIVDTRSSSADARKACGLMLDADGCPFSVEKVADGVLKATFGDKSITFFEDRMEINAPDARLYGNSLMAYVAAAADEVELVYRGRRYRVRVEGASVVPDEGDVTFVSAGGCIVLYPETVGCD